MPITIHSALKANEQAFLTELLRVTPRPYLNTPDDEHTRNYKLLGVAQMALYDYNQTPPAESYRFESLPREIFPLIVYGTQFYLQQLKQMEFSLVDLSYNSSGLSITLDRVGKINTPLQNFEKNWANLIQKRKNIVLISMGGVGLATMRFNSTMSRAITSLATGGAFAWGIP